MKPKWLVVILSSAFALFWACNTSSKQGVSFAKDIAPIIHTNCSPCHHKGGAGPFNLITYQDVSDKAKTVAEVTKARYMPPWPADPNYSHFKGEKFLTETQINLIQQWVEEGKQAGDTQSIKYPELQYYSSLGKPDVVLELPEIEIQGDARDRFLVVKNLGQILQDTFVRAIEFIPNQKTYVHHVNGFMLNYQKAPPKSTINVLNIESELYEKDFAKLNLLDPSQPVPQRIHSAFNYLPGVFAAAYPEGIGGFKMNKNFALICNDLHYGPAEKDTTDRSKIHIYFAKSPPKRPTKELMMGTNGVSSIKPPLVIEPNEIKTCRSSLYIPESISILTINPHMHLIGESFKAFVVDANKDTIPLISIPEWDFRWQYFYTYPKMLKIPAGSTIHVEALFDNTLDNYNNPFDPPQRIQERTDLFGAGMKTTDEMLQFIITYLPYELGDEEIEL